MSWDFWMEEENHTCPTCGRSAPPLDYSANYTYNVSPMFYEAFELKDGIRDLDGKTGEDCIPLLLHAIKAMCFDPKKYKEMNPKNKWGNYEGALKLLQKLLEWCTDQRTAIMRVG